RAGITVFRGSTSQDPARQLILGVRRQRGDRMAELEPGHPDGLIHRLRNWLQEAQDPIGSLPAGTDPVEWAVRRFIDTWKTEARRSIEAVEESLNRAKALCDSQASFGEIKSEIDMARQALQEDLRDHLGLYDLGEKE